MDATGICNQIDKRKLMMELAQGQESARRLQALLQNPVGEDGSELVGQLVEKVLRSLELGLDLLGPSSNQTGENGPRSPGGEQHQVTDFSFEEDPDKGDKKRPVTRDKRGCYKRRKSSQTTRVTVSSTTEDDHAWRKYGQKCILNSKFPRSYFRCTHKYDQGCKATKQVQMMEDDPCKYHTTYIGAHTCNRHPMTWDPPHTSDHVNEEINDPVEAKSDGSTTTIDNLSGFCPSLLEKPAFGLQEGRFDQSEDPVSMMYRLGMKDEEIQSEMECMLIGNSLGHYGFCDFHLDESYF
ncbi:hypothetical protein SAY86_009251 [Trapa natans]|uniref:WRKY domain-containing protein n=1 Tax=Trapa natans TaxID=22666 RepID=A0AAN7QR13_TRANT|nr:hypothetical protein SAY86_009251 [Trapa natans]